ncbi:MAG: ImmA/IrrE family metallo-endopeptidase [Methylacidiphilales bacterium]|nr:ImmA/IrrE family metallo-endopeptidase [Candidatus Methylacidiphilales bacterium]
MDASKFKAPYLRKEEIWDRVDKLRKEASFGQSFPIDVLGMAEFDLGLELVPAYGLRQQCDTEAILLGDLKTILVDKESFTNSRQEYRLRFSVAHEIGHLILHGDVYQNIRPPTADTWVSFISELPDDQYNYLEYHANEFAGRLLVPRDRLEASLDEALQLAKSRGIKDWNETTLSYLATYISKSFNVSSEVISRRLRIEKLWPLS